MNKKAPLILRLAVAAVFTFLSFDGAGEALPPPLIDDYLASINKPIEATFSAIGRGLTGGVAKEATKFMSEVDARARGLIDHADGRIRDRLKDVRAIVEQASRNMLAIVDRAEKGALIVVDEIRLLEKQTFSDLDALQIEIFKNVHCAVGGAFAKADIFVDDLKSELTPPLWSAIFYRKDECEKELDYDRRKAEAWEHLKLYNYRECKTRKKLENELRVPTVVVEYLELNILAGNLQCAATSGDDERTVKWFTRKRLELMRRHDIWSWAGDL